MSAEETKTAYRKPKAMPLAAAKHTDQTSREFRLLQASQKLGVPSTLMQELTGMSKTEMHKCYNNEDVVPLEWLGKTNKFFDVLDIALDLQLLPTTDYNIIRNVLALCYTVKNLEDELQPQE
jgi:hypothetical protein